MFSYQEKGTIHGKREAKSLVYQQFSIASLVCVALRLNRLDGYVLAFAPRYPSRLIYVQRWHKTRGCKNMRCSKELVYAGHHDDITSLAWSPDQQAIASASEDRTVQIWDAVSGQQLLSFGGFAGVTRVLAWSPDGKRLAIGNDDNMVECFNLETQRKLFTLDGHKTGYYGIDALAWAPDGSRIASAGDDKIVRIWDAASGQQLLRYHGHAENWVRALAWSPDGRLIASAGDDIQIWDALTGQHLLTYTEHRCTSDWIDGLAWVPGGDIISSIDTSGELRLWHTSTGKTCGIYHHSTRDEQETAEYAHTVVWSASCTAYTVYKDCAALAVAAKG